MTNATPIKAKNTRAQAARLIAQLMINQSSLANLIPKYLPTIDPQDSGLFKELCFGSMRYFPRLAGIANQLIKKPLKEKDNDIYALLILGLYQLSYTRVPDHAALATTVDASVALRKNWAKSFINGVLRQYQRHADTLIDNLSEAERFSHPDWFLGMVKKRWPDYIDQIIVANNVQPPMTLRVNGLKTNRDDYLALLAEQGIDAKACQYSVDGINLSHAKAVEELPHFSQGWASVQDESAQLAAGLIGIKDGERVLDACCAPGGKTCHLLEQGTTATVHGLELVEGKLERVEQNLQRLGLQATLFAGDASEPEHWFDGQQYDKILLDAPCSATGVIRRNPDVKVMRQPEDIATLAELQLKILTALWPLLKPGGRLVYATCSIMPQENSLLLKRFAELTGDCQHRPIAAAWGIEQTFGRQLLTGLQDGDGFFYACIEKATGGQ
ncbi:Ribosomal RNA small subunit methyltransferase B [Sinobacterium norvegicum]|uniref:16S rRNA (cytosine(967)-C(5))-methyltransferase n=1 Tax=Sinobacterium norvegicum TaxID=1641715 RepID=A0ABM9AJR4_9GAMM|nr:16S rRNA (cytosine(967)-C(5))-methyltransferase RsmB [Sinobacterium norvegicum]CAH0993007.1 Ribosomal RNA small subunit methyltransferase B [Sinobacterium norvegicum]